MAFPFALRRNAGPVAVLGLLIVVSGCGLDVYERKLGAEQERIKRFDEADQLLGNPVDFPLRVNTSLPVPSNFPRDDNLFFRAPVVIAQKPDGIPIDGILYRYARTTVQVAGASPAPAGRRGAGQPVLPPPAIFGPLTPDLEKETGFREMFIAMTGGGKVEEFKKRILANFQITNKPERRTVERFGLPELKYEAWTFTDPAKPTSVYYIFMNQNGRYLVALVYHLGREKANNQTVRNALQYSLQSLVLGPDATLVNQNYKMRPPPNTKPAF